MKSLTELITNFEQFTINKLMDGLTNTDNKEACWEWQGGSTQRGYGKITIPGSLNVTTHTLMYILMKGDIPEAHEILHSCDNPRCCNPDHLRTGTHLENMIEASDRRNLRKINTNKLTIEAAREIRQLYKEGWTMNKIGIKFQVSTSCIQLVINNKTWQE